MVVILQKMVMTGAMCVVAQGSSVQLLIAIMVMLMYMLLGKWDKNVCRLCRWFGFYLNIVLLSFFLSCSLEDGSF